MYRINKGFVPLTEGQLGTYVRLASHFTDAKATIE